MKKIILNIGLLLSMPGTSFALNLDMGDAPYLYPKKCDILLDARGFELYNNKDCSVIYLGPQRVEKPIHIPRLESTIDMCDDNNMLQETLKKNTESILLNADDILNAQKEKNSKKIELHVKLAKELVDLKQYNLGLYYAIASLPAASVQSLFDNTVSGSDRDKFIDANKYVLLNQAVRPDVQILKTTNSVYSFLFKKVGEGDKVSAISSTSLPGLEYLSAPGAKQSDIVHVMTNDSISGDTVFTLKGACTMVEKHGESWKLKQDPISYVMTANRTYDIPMKIGYGMTASLKTNVAIKNLQALVSQSLDHGLTKTQILNAFLKSEGESIFDVFIDTDIALSSEQRSELMADVYQRLTDRFLLFFEKSGLLSGLQPIEIEPQPLEPAQGGMVPEIHTATHCWKKKSLFGSKSGCYDYQYTVMKWHDGFANDEVNQNLQMDALIKENYQINDIYNYQMSSTFFDLEAAELTSSDSL